jgi:PPOX class probable F420-dependent enzyme
MAKLPDAWKAALKKPIFIHLTTLMPDGSPQASPVWVDVDGDTILVNSAQGRVKDKNIRRDPRIAISATDPDNPYNPLMLRGKVVGISTDGADAHIDAMAKKYLGKDKYPYARPGEVRVLYRIQADNVAGQH